jgi:hypothetical protein
MLEGSCSEKCRARRNTPLEAATAAHSGSHDIVPELVPVGVLVLVPVLVLYQ